jgi:hypothetical protein
VPIPYTAPIRGTSSKMQAPPTLDLTLLLFVRAADAVIQSEVWKRTDMYRPRWEVKTRNALGKALASEDINRETQLKKQQEAAATKRHQKLASRIDAFIFWSCSARFGLILL